MPLSKLAPSWDPRSPRRRRGAPLLLAAALVALPGLGGPLGAAPAAAAPAAVDVDDRETGSSGPVRATPESPVQVEVTTLAPRAPTTPEEPFQVRGVLTNRGDQTVREVEVRLLVGPVLRSRGALERADEEPVVGQRRGEAVAADDPVLAPGASTTFDLRVPVATLQLRALGVHPLAVQARGVVQGERAGTAVGLATTYVPWFPDGPPARTRIAWLWPLVDQPRRGPRDVLVDDELRSSLAFGDDDRGRLGRVLASARAGAEGACDPPAGLAPGQERPVPPTPCRADPVPLTFGVDPDLLHTVEAMGSPRGYTVRAGDGVENRPTSGAAQAWTASLREAASTAAVLALPWADPDVVALTRRGVGLGDDVQQSTRLGQREATRILDREPLGDIAWPPAGGLTTPALEALAAGGASTLVLDEVALPPAPFDQARTPEARTDLSTATGPVTGLVVEQRLSALLEPDVERWQGARLAEQRWIAETAMIAAERPSESRTLVVAPPRRFDVVPSVAVAVLHDTGRLPWLCPVDLASAAEGTETCPGEAPPTEPREAELRGDLEPPRDGDPELSAAHLSEVAAIRALSAQFTESVLQPGGEEAARTRSRLLRARARAESSAWRAQPMEGRRMRRLLLDDIADLRGRVKLQVATDGVTLTGTTGTIDVQISNELGQPVTVGVDLSSPDRARLTSSDTEVREVPGGTAVPVRIRVEARASGSFPVIATLLDRDGNAFGEPVELLVRSTQYGRVALAVTGIGAAVLLVAAGARITRRALRRGAAA